MQKTTQNKSLPTDKFLTVAINLLNKALLEASRTEAKQLYRQLEEGKTITLTHVRMEDESLVRFDLALSHELYEGRLGFSSFRTGLTVLIANIVEALKEPDKIRTFRNQEDPESVMFGVLAATEEDGRPSILSLGADPSRDEARVMLRLSYLDYRQFADASGDASTGSDADTTAG
jgi:hypothetical protein